MSTRYFIEEYNRNRYLYGECRRCKSKVVRSLQKFTQSEAKKSIDKALSKHDCASTLAWVAEVKRKYGTK